MDPETLRDDMVDGLEHAVDDLGGRVGMAMRNVPRRTFVPENPYDNRDGEHAGTRVLAPATVARLIDALDVHDGDRVLVVGVGVGYTAAVIADLVGARNVHAVDIARRVVIDARRNLGKAGYDAVLVDCRDGADGFPEYAPFDRILLEAAAVRPPRPLLDQLTEDGQLVMPMGDLDQTLVSVARQRRDSTGRDRGRGNERGEILAEHGPVAFRPLLVEGEQSGGPIRNRTEREDREHASREGYFAPTGWEHDWIDWDQHI